MTNCECKLHHVRTEHASSLKLAVRALAWANARPLAARLLAWPVAAGPKLAWCHLAVHLRARAPPQCPRGAPRQHRLQHRHGHLDAV